MPWPAETRHGVDFHFHTQFHVLFEERSFMARSFLAHCFALAAIGVCTPALLAQDHLLDDLYGRGVHAYFSRNFQDAHKLLSEAVTSGSKDPRVYYFRALADMRLGRPDDAAADLKLATEFEFNGDEPVQVSKALERVQGAERLNIEEARRKARLSIRNASEERAKIRYENRVKAEAAVLRKVPASAAPPAAAPAAPPAKPAAEKPVTPAEAKPAAPAKPAVEDPFGDAPAKPAAAKPAAPAAEKPAAPATEKPAAPAKPAVEDPFGDAPAKPAPGAAEKPAAPAKPAVEDPFADTPAKPAAEKPAEPAGEKPAAPAEEKPEEAAAENAPPK
jgi:hypothetical protein